ncbi:hypothetical protein B0A49_10838 [Cryomyces minteri]|uniref:VanZ-like domain-containing protein n=1 Tax=Cryomyces minteri TaxID=331657 RepID=A0A4U0W818_9PEZI|nr:hypothetical protein B0A49_10838 [Cryomyces minteri]
MRIRLPFAGAFTVLILAAAYLGLAPSTIPNYGQSDKVLHFVTFFLLTLCFYWILETNRRRNLQLTVLVCTALLGVGSEVVQGLLPNGRNFDPYDILANVLGSGAAIGACSWYHKRMLERKRQAKYDFVPGDDNERDVELGEGLGASGSQESGVAMGGGAVGEGVGVQPTVEQELDNWDENAEDWDEDEPASAEGEGPKTPNSSAEDPANGKKRDD